MAVKLRDCYLYIAILVQLIAIASPQFITSLDISADQGNSNLFASVPPTVDPSFSSTNVPWTVVQPPQSQGQPLQQQDQNELPVLAQTQPSPNSPIVADTTFSSSDQLNQPPDQQNSLLTSTDTLQTIAEAACPQAPSKKAASLFRRIPPRICCPDVDPSDELFWGWRMDSPAKRGAYCCEGGSIEYAEIRTCVNYDPAAELCKNPDNWACCVGGMIYPSKKIGANKCLSYYPPPVPVPNPQPGPAPVPSN